MTDSATLQLPECWGVDTNTKLNAQSAANLARAPLPNGKRIEFVFRYVPFNAGTDYDITLGEAQAILNAGLTLLLVQHCRNPGWEPTQELGESYGKAATARAMAVGYPASCHIALDLEGVATDAPPAVIAQFIETWADCVAAAGYEPLLYVGYACGLTPEQLWLIPNIHRYWSDFGSRAVNIRGFCCKQHVQVTVAGVQVDPDHHQPDQLGGCLVGMSLARNQPPPTNP